MFDCCLRVNGMFYVIELIVVVYACILSLVSGCSKNMNYWQVLYQFLTNVRWDCYLWESLCEVIFILSLINTRDMYLHSV